MSDVKRWTALRKTSGHQGMVQDPRGQWVALDDHEAALKAAAKEATKLREENLRLHRALFVIRDGDHESIGDERELADRAIRGVDLDDQTI